MNLDTVRRVAPLAEPNARRALAISNIRRRGRVASSHSLVRRWNVDWTGLLDEQTGRSVRSMGTSRPLKGKRTGKAGSTGRPGGCRGTRRRDERTDVATTTAFENRQDGCEALPRMDGNEW